MQAWVRRDPITTLRERGRTAKLLGEAETLELEQRVKAEIDDGGAFADAAPVELAQELAWRVTMKEAGR